MDLGGIFGFGVPISFLVELALAGVDFVGREEPDGLKAGGSEEVEPIGGVGGLPVLGLSASCSRGLRNI